jgi:hypothetical protein
MNNKMLENINLTLYCNKNEAILSKLRVPGGNAFDSGLGTPGSIPGKGGFDTFCRNYIFFSK